MILPVRELEKAISSGGTWQDYIIAEGQRISQRTQKRLLAATDMAILRAGSFGSVVFVVTGPERQR